MTLSCAETPRATNTTTAQKRETCARRTRSTILQALALIVAVAALPAPASGQPSAGVRQDDPRWTFEAAGQAAVEGWNYNGSHEELYGESQVLARRLPHRVQLRMGQRFIYVSQRGNDGLVLGLTIGVRKAWLAGTRTSIFLQGDVGVSHTAVAAPPRGTRFNYLAIGGVGIKASIAARLSLIGAAEVFHLSNASLRGPGRNPDIEAVGLSVGLAIPF